MLKAWNFGLVVKKGSVAKIRCYLKLSRSVRINVSQFQRAKKVVSDSPGLVDFAIELVNFCPTAGEVFGGIQITELMLIKPFFFRPS